MFWRNKKPSSKTNLPAGIEAEISSLAAKLNTEPKPRKPSISWRAFKLFFDRFEKDHRSYSYDTKRWQGWVGKELHWMNLFSLIGWLTSVLATGYLFERTGLSILWLTLIFIPLVSVYLTDHDRLCFFMSVCVGITGYLLPQMQWRGLFIQMAFPTLYMLIRVRREARALRQEETERAAREVANPIDKLLKLIEKHRQKIIGTGSEFGAHLAKLEKKLSQIRNDKSHWEGRVRQEPDSKLFAARLAEAQAMEKRLIASCDALYKKKQEIVAGLDDLQARVPTISSEIDDWRQDREHQALMDEAGLLADETEAVVRRAIQAFAADIQQIAGQIEGLRIQIAGGTCEPKLIVETERKVGEIVDDTGTIVATPKTTADAAVS